MNVNRRFSAVESVANLLRKLKKTTTRNATGKHRRGHLAVSIRSTFYAKPLTYGLGNRAISTFDTQESLFGFAYSQ